MKLRPHFSRCTERESLFMFPESLKSICNGPMKYPVIRNIKSRETAVRIPGGHFFQTFLKKSAEVGNWLLNRSC